MTEKNCRARVIRVGGNRAAVAGQSASHLPSLERVGDRIGGRRGLPMTFEGCGTPAADDSHAEREIRPAVVVRTNSYGRVAKSETPHAPFVHTGRLTRLDSCTAVGFSVSCPQATPSGSLA